MTRPPGWADMSRVFGRIGLLSFGGPAAQIALMQDELIERRRWLDQPAFLRALSLCMLLPGPEAMQLATYAGWRLRGIPGGVLAGLLFVLPGAAVTAALVFVYSAWGTQPLVQSAFLGVKAAVIVIVFQALRRMAGKLRDNTDGIVIATLAFTGIFAFGAPFPGIIAAAAAWGWWRAAGTSVQPDLRATPFRGVSAAVLLGWGGLWLLPLAALSLTGPALLAEIGWFFARLAVVTFGGAYAVLAYMTQTVVEDQGWITTGQMIDALGLAETTPGPLILVTQFVAMLTGQIHGGTGLALAAGAVALWATFVPCFLWIFLAGPHLDRLAAMPRLSAALQAITAAVVGVILNLAVVFALNVLFGSAAITVWGPVGVPVPQDPDWRAAGLTGLAALMMVGFGRGLGVVLPVMAIAGLALGLM